MMYRTIRYLDENLQGHIDFSTFHLLAVIPRGEIPPVVMLVPRFSNEPQNFNLQVGPKSLWFGSLDNMLLAAKEYYRISDAWVWRCRRRYAALKNEIHKKAR